MRELIIRRIEEIFRCSARHEMRWQGFWFDREDYHLVGKLTRKEMVRQNPIHIFDIDWKVLTDEKLGEFFEMIVRRYYAQYG
jgi:hypothetical protein